MARTSLWTNLTISLKSPLNLSQCCHFSNFVFFSTKIKKPLLYDVSFKPVNDVNLIHHVHSKPSKIHYPSFSDEISLISKLDQIEICEKHQYKNLLLNDKNYLEITQDSLNNIQHYEQKTFSSKETLYSIKKRNRSKVMSLIFEEKTFNNLVNILIKELNLSYNDACLILHYFKYFKPCYMSHCGVVRFINELKSVINYCQIYFSNQDILECHHLLTMRLETIRNRILILEEFGFKNLRPNLILNFFSLINKSGLELKKIGIIDDDTHIIKSLLNCLSTLSLKEKAKIEKELDPNWSIIKTKTKICKAYLKIRYKSSSHFVYLFEINSIPVSRIHQVVESIRSLNLTTIQAFSSFKYLFFIDSKQLDFLFNHFSQMFEDELLKILIIKLNLSRYSLPLIFNNTLLIKNNFKLSNKQIEFCPESLTIDSNLLKKRLNNLVKRFGSTILKSNYILSCATLPSSVIDENFANIKDNTDLSQLNFILNELFKTKILNHFNYKNHLLEIIYFLSKELNVHSKVIKNELFSHPFRKYINLDDSKQVWEYLLSLQSLSKNQLIKGICIIIYDVNLVKHYFQLLKSSKAYDEWAQHDMMLLYLVYMIEKDRKLDGSGVLIGKI